MSDASPSIVILGGGFAGVAVAQELARRLSRDAATVSLVSHDNYQLFHPMLPEVAGAGIEPGHILSPIRLMCRNVRLVEGLIEEIDLARRVVVVAYGPHASHLEVPFDYLVIAVGTVTNFSELTGMAQHAFPMKTIGDALFLHNHVVGVLEQADVELDPVRRAGLLTFVVAGGGFSGVETIAELNDYIRQAIRHYPRIDPSAIRLILLHAGARILPELTEDLASFALRHLERRGIVVRLNTLLEGATEDEALLRGGEILPTFTLVSTIGTAPNPVLAALTCAKDQRGRLLVNGYLEVEGVTGVWALGDCAAVPNADSGTLAPPTAQFAQREGKLVGRNVAAALARRPQAQFSYHGMGQFVALGRRSAVAEVFGRKIHGFVAWWMWRTVYLGKLPSWSRRARVALDWTLDLMFGRDIVQLPLSRTHHVGRAHYRPGDIVFSEGEFGDEFYVVIEGDLEVCQKDESGQERVVNRLHEGDYFGELALLRGRARSATVRAVTAVNVLTLGRDDFTVLSQHWSVLKRSLRETVPARGPDPGPR